MSVTAEVVRHEQVGKDWESCPDCGCRYVPGAWCPYIEYHAGFAVPQPVFPPKGWRP